MDVQNYLESGVLEAYCLGMLSDEEQAYLIQMTMLYPDIKAELTAVELSLENMAAAHAIEPNPANKQNVLSALGFIQTAKLDADKLPFVSQNADPEPWLTEFAHLLDPEPLVDFTCHILRDDPEVKQMLVISKIDVPEEDHSDFLESLFILKGHCQCTIGNNFYTLMPGDFIEIPLNTPHNIKITTPIVTAILQYKYV